MLLNDNVKMALTSLKSSRWRSVLTLLGIIVGVASVVTIVSFGEGLKQQVKHQFGQFGSDLITVRPGQTVSRDSRGKIIGVDLFTVINQGTLSEQDVSLIRQTAGVKTAAPLSLLPANVVADERQLTNTPILGTSAGLPEVLHQKLDYGGFFGPDDDTKNVAVVGRIVAQDLFAENVPIGRSFRWRDQTFLVRGVFGQLPANPLLPTVDLNRVIFVPYGTLKSVSGTASISQIVAQPKQASEINEVVSRLTTNLFTAHSGQNDFTVLKQAENSLPATALVDVVTQVIAGIAAVSLIMGGVSIMNIMLVAVTERTREIGIRKAIGATNRQILSQFLVEATVLSLAGGIIGIIAAYAANFILIVTTSLHPVITLWVIGLALIVALAVGVVFGITPAFKAARKDPIDALRYE